MHLYAIPIKFFSLINIDFTALKDNGYFVDVKTDFTSAEFLEIQNSDNEEYLVFETLQDAKVMAVLLSRIYTEHSKHVACSVKQFATPLIYEMDTDSKPKLRPVNAHLVSKYMDYKSIPFYLFESKQSEIMYLQQILDAYKRTGNIIPLCGFTTINTEPTAVYFLNASTNFEEKKLSVPANVVPFTRPRLCR